MSENRYIETIKVEGAQLLEKVKELIHEGNVNHLVIKHDGHTIVEIPVTVGLISVALAPLLAAVAALGAVVTSCTIDIVRTNNAAM